MKPLALQIEILLKKKYRKILCFFLYLCFGFNSPQAEKPRFADITTDSGIILSTQEELTNVSFLQSLDLERPLRIMTMTAILICILPVVILIRPPGNPPVNQIYSPKTMEMGHSPIFRSRLESAAFPMEPDVE